MTPDRRFRFIAIAALALSVALSACTAAAPDAGSGVPDDQAQSTSSSPSPSGDADPGNGEASDEASEGSSDSDSSDSGSSDSGSSGGASSPSPSASQAQPAPPAAVPTAVIIDQKCKSAKLTVTLTANADNSYRKGISAVLLERQNEYNAWLDYAATWLGPETGQGNQWTGQLVGNTQGIGKTLRVTVTPASGTPLTFTTPITANC